MNLRRVLGLRTVVSTSAGLAYAAINFLALVQIASFTAGDAAWLAILVAGALCLLAAGCFAELTCALPSAAGIRMWTRRGLTDGFSLGFTLLYLTTVLAVIAADAFILGAALQAGIPQVPGLLWIALFLALVLLANLRGVKVAGLVQDLTTYALLASLVVVALAALLQPGVHVRAPLAVGGAEGLFQAVAVGVFVFVGFEWVTPLAEEVTDGLLVPRGMLWALGLLAVSFGLFSLAMQALLPPQRLMHSLVPQLLVGRRAFGALGFWWMLLVTTVTAATTFNGSFVSASRLLFGLARERSVPPSLAQLNARLVPHRALWLLFGLSLALVAAVYATRAYLLLIDAGSALEAAMYVVVALTVLGLRRKEPALPRPVRLPGGPLIPLLTVAVFAPLAVGSALLPLGTSPVPWTLVWVGALALGAAAYVRWVVPRLRARAQGTRRAADGQAPGGRRDRVL